MALKTRSAYFRLSEILSSGFHVHNHDLKWSSSHQLQDFYDHFVKSSNSIRYLRKLYRILHCNGDKELPEDVTIVLLSTACDPKLSASARKICVAILQESLPNYAVTHEDLAHSAVSDEPTTIQIMLAFQQDKQAAAALTELSDSLIRAITSSDVRIDRKLSSLRVLTQLAASTGYELHLNKDEQKLLCKHLKQSLNCSESLVRLTSDTSGTISTVLSTAFSANSSNQMLSIQAFSIINQLWPVIFGNGEVDKDLVVKITDYCLAIIEKAESPPILQQDSNFEQAALSEAILILDKVCQVDSSNVLRLIPVIRRIHDRIGTLEVALLSLQFLLNHRSHVAYDPCNELEKLFSVRIGGALPNLCSCCEIVMFITNNLETLNSLSPLRLWFPNILKILAWFPVTFASEFLEILPTFMDGTTSIEVFSCILDLPCLCAAMICEMSEEHQLPPRIQQSLKSTSCKTALRSILSKTSGTAKTADDIALIHKLLEDLRNDVRVTCCASIVPALLDKYFQVIDTFADLDLTSQLVLVMLDRTYTIFPIQDLAEDIQRRFAKVILRIFQRHPCLIVETKLEICNFLCNAKNLSQELCINLIWAIGNYTSISFSKNPSLNLARSYYDTLECLIYEHLSHFSPRSVSIVTSTIIKLASRCQDLLPRVLLCLTKINHMAKAATTDEWETVAARTDEFIAVLGEPNVASMALSPPLDFLNKHYLCDTGSLPMVLRAASVLVPNNLNK